MYDDDIKQSGAKINYHMLETNRICAANQFESNFHIFYTLLLGASCDFLHKLCLDPGSTYKVNINIEIILFNHTCPQISLF